MGQNHITLQNVIFTHKYLLKGFYFKYIFFALFVVASDVATTFLFMALPAVTIKLLQTSYNLYAIIAQMTSLLIGTFFLSIISKRLEHNINRETNSRRMSKTKDYYLNIISMDYEKVENHVNKKLFDAGLTSFYDGYHEGFHHIIIDSRKLLVNVLGLIVYIFFIAKINYIVAFMLVFISALSIFINHYYKKWITKNELNWLEQDSKIKYVSREAIVLRNAKDVKVYGIKEWFGNLYDEFTFLRQHWHQKELLFLCIVKIGDRFLAAAKYFIAYLSVFYKLLHGMEVSEFVFSIGLIMGLNSWVSGIFENIQFLQLNAVHVENSRKVFSMQKDNILDQELNLASAGLNQVEIKFVDVTFKFPESEKVILEHFNLTISAGERVGIVGINGAGKSTLIKLMCGLYHPTSGKILLNGYDIMAFPTNTVYKLFSAVFQEYGILSAKISENISCMPEKDTDMKRVMECLRKVGLYEKVQRLPKGSSSLLTKEINQEGIILSGGEYQKLLLARCLYHDRPIYLLDEPTAALDAISENEIYELYDKFSDGKTCIYVSHRLNSTKFCDRIVLLKDGKIIEEGTHEQLMKKQGEYANMYQIQSSYYKKETNYEEGKTF